MSERENMLKAWVEDYVFATHSRRCEANGSGGFTWLATRGAMLIRYL